MLESMVSAFELNGSVEAGNPGSILLTLANYNAFCGALQKLLYRIQEQFLLEGSVNRFFAVSVYINGRKVYIQSVYLSISRRNP